MMRSKHSTDSACCGDAPRPDRFSKLFRTSVSITTRGAQRTRVASAILRLAFRNRQHSKSECFGPGQTSLMLFASRRYLSRSRALASARGLTSEPGRRQRRDGIAVFSNMAGRFTEGTLYLLDILLFIWRSLSLWKLSEARRLAT